MTSQSAISPAKAWYSLAVLFLLFVFSYIDRSALSLFVDPIKTDLGIKDTQFSLITGAAFALFYSVMAVPIAIWADQRSRKWIIIAGVVLWAAMTAACGVANGFWMLFVLRMGVGLGEAALTPNAWAMVPEMFPARLQGRAMSLFVSGGVLGSGLALILPTFITTTGVGVISSLVPAVSSWAAWRLVLFGLAVLTFAACVPALFTANIRSTAGAAAHWLSLRQLWSRRNELTALFLAGPLLNAVAVGTMTWLPAYFMRTRGWSIADAGYRVGIALVISGFIGVFASGWLADRLALARDADRALRVVGATSLLSLPCLLGMLLLNDSMVALACVTVALAFNNFMTTLLPLAVQARSAADQRAQTAALFLLVANLIGFTLGPALPALVSDYVLRDPSSIGWALLMVATVCTLLSARLIFHRHAASVEPSTASGINQ